jgi:hypothetical protein
VQYVLFYNNIDRLGAALVTATQRGISVASRVGGARVGCRVATEVSVAKDAAARASFVAKLLLLLLPLSVSSPRIDTDSPESPLAVWAAAGVYLPHPWRVF